MTSGGDVRPGESENSPPVDDRVSVALSVGLESVHTQMKGSGIPFDGELMVDVGVVESSPRRPRDGELRYERFGTDQSEKLPPASLQFRTGGRRFEPLHQIRADRGRSWSATPTGVGGHLLKVGKPYHPASDEIVGESGETNRRDAGGEVDHRAGRRSDRKVGDLHYVFGSDVMCPMNDEVFEVVGSAGMNRYYGQSASDTGKFVELGRSLVRNHRRGQRGDRCSAEFDVSRHRSDPICRSSEGDPLFSSDPGGDLVRCEAELERLDTGDHATLGEAEFEDLEVWMGHLLIMRDWCDHVQGVVPTDHPNRGLSTGLFAPGTQGSRRAPLTSGGMKWRERVFLGMVAVLPLHTVFWSAWISWKPFLVGLIILAVADLVDGLRGRFWPWHRRLTIWLAVFFGVVAIGFPEPVFRARFVRLTLALMVGALVMLVTERRLRNRAVFDHTLTVIFWSGAVMVVTGVLISLVAVGAFGNSIINSINDIPGVFRLFKPAYLKSGFLALTNWHQDPGYGAAWTVLWSVLAMFAALRGRGSRRWWVDSSVVGGLWFLVAMAFSRTGWLAVPIAHGLVAWAMRREVRLVELVRRYAVAGVAAVALLAGVWSADAPEVGGDLDLQFAFRFGQGWDLLADLTGWFDSSESFADRFEPSEERADVWPEYLGLFKDHPLLGVGLSVGWQTNSIGQEPHNLVIELLAEMGIVGLLAFAGLVTAICRSGAGKVGGVALAVTFLPSLTQTVLFEPTWWFAAGLFLGGCYGDGVEVR